MVDTVISREVVSKVVHDTHILIKSPNFPGYTCDLCHCRESNLFKPCRKHKHSYSLLFSDDEFLCFRCKLCGESSTMVRKFYTRLVHGERGVPHSIRDLRTKVNDI